MAGEGLPWRSSILGTLLFLPSSLREADSFLQHRSKPLSLPPARTAIGLRTDAAVSGRGTAGGTVGRVPSADADGCTGAGSVPAWTRVGWAAVLATAVPATGVGWAAGWAARVSIAQRRELRIWLGERRAFVLAVAFLCSLSRCHLARFTFDEGYRFNNRGELAPPTHPTTSPSPHPSYPAT